MRCFLMEFTLLCCKIRVIAIHAVCCETCFVAILRFFCVETNYAQDFVCGEKMSNIMYGDVPHPICNWQLGNLTI